MLRAGATHASQCYSTNQCTTGEDNCSWHALCEDLPDENDVASFVCKCKPGYRGNGTHCEGIIGIVFVDTDAIVIVFRCMQQFLSQ